jgi:hypothetical protein
MGGRVHQGTRWSCDDHPSYAANGHHHADGTGRPTAFLEEYAEKWPYAGLRVSNEEVEGLYRGAWSSAGVKFLLGIHSGPTSSFDQ